MSDAADRLVQELRGTRKYRHLCDEALARIAHWALARHPSPREAAAAARRKLHQAFAAYCVPAALDRLAGEVAGLPDPADTAAFRAGCLRLLGRHASTAERCGLLATLYPALWREVGRPRVLLDLACGYHPFALPWMGLDETTAYHACDIDDRLVAGGNAFLARLGRPPTVVGKDLLVGMPACRADVALLFKTLPCLEQQEKGVAPSLLRAVPARQVIVSFPAASLGGRDRGMRDSYDRRMAEVIAELGVPARRLAFPGETFYVLTMMTGGEEG